MESRLTLGLHLLTAACLAAGCPLAAIAQTGSGTPRQSPRSASMTARATGTFDVQLKPQQGDDYADGVSLGRMTIDKQYRGDLDGAAKGQMLTALTAVKGSAAYVAIERVSGAVHGRRGSFVLVHRGIMAGGGQELNLTVVPDSGTEQLAGISGTMRIQIADGRHSYEFEYALPKAP